MTAGDCKAAAQHYQATKGHQSPPVSLSSGPEDTNTTPPMATDDTPQNTSPTMATDATQQNITPTMATDKTQLTEFPESCPSFNSASMYTYVTLSYQLWDKPHLAPHNQLVERIPYFRPLRTCKMSMRVNMADLTFHRFKALVYSYVEENISNWNHVHNLMKAADKLHQLKWRCTIPVHSKFNTDQNYCATDEASFRPFATSAGLHYGGTPSVDIIMQEPNDVELQNSPPVAGCPSPPMINIESPPTTYLVADSKNRSASCGSLVAVDVEVKTHGQDDKKNAPYVVEQPYATVTNQDRKSSKKAKSIRFNIRPSKNGRKHCHIDMDAFLTLCHIPHSNYKTQYLVQKNCLHHWSVFKLLTPVDLKSMRFSIGLALLLS
ncbi:hypothetical protein PCASD_20837 [Puccinia coronata f. sp. avenae]|uniref:Uncharacterized protein n=1 Tax=Puccinia coronata f. sp. avenae TaxID=200324 RepID=A0A2N5TYG7_9BASI|nr:hypothetical protein PCASD_20837 [Puccinia coronata f. sp. avenae]